MRRTKHAAACTSMVVVGILASACGGDPPPAPQTPPAPTVAAATPPPPPPETKPEPPPPPKPSLAELQMKTMKGYGEAFTDTAKLGAFLTDDVSTTIEGMPEMKGKDAVLKGHDSFVSGFSDLKSSASRVWQKGDVVVSEWVMTGTNSKEWMGMKATNKSFGLNGASITWFNADGLIKEQHVYFDGGTMMAQLGVSKQKVRPAATLPSGTPEIHVAKGTPDEDKNVDTVKAIETTLDTKKEADFLASMDDAMEYEAFTQPAPTKGKAEAKKFFQMWTKAFPDAKTTVVNSWGIEDYALVESTMTGTQKGPIGPIKATNKSVNLHSFEIFKVANGKTTRGWSYTNSGELMSQLGLIPQPGAPKAEVAKPADAKKPAAPAAPKK